ncbi:MAG TPA: LytTR family DNA-binding domain-containing protein [Clostridia bacterium]|nr:LytTR family DNA-binding domain-containing protein [Clostridia bacterium]
MKIRVEHGDFEENVIVLHCRELDDEMLDVLSLLREHSHKLVGYKDGEAHILKPGDIFYAEAVDGKTFLYTVDMVLETHQSLSSLLETYGDMQLIRIGKSQLVNLYHVAKLKSLPNTRIEITLKNSERLIVSRHYTQNLKENLGIQE